MSRPKREIEAPKKRTSAVELWSVGFYLKADRTRLKGLLGAFAGEVEFPVSGEVFARAIPVPPQTVAPPDSPPPPGCEMSNQELLKNLSAEARLAKARDAIGRRLDLTKAQRDTLAEVAEWAYMRVPVSFFKQRSVFDGFADSFFAPAALRQREILTLDGELRRKGKAGALAAEIDGVKNAMSSDDTSIWFCLRVTKSALKAAVQLRYEEMRANHPGNADRVEFLRKLLELPAMQVSQAFELLERVATDEPVSKSQKGGSNRKRQKEALAQLYRVARLYLRLPTHKEMLRLADVSDGDDANYSSRVLMPIGLRALLHEKTGKPSKGKVVKKSAEPITSDTESMRRIPGHEEPSISALFRSVLAYKT